MIKKGLACAMAIMLMFSNLSMSIVMAQETEQNETNTEFVGVEGEAVLEDVEENPGIESQQEDQQIAESQVDQSQDNEQETEQQETKEPEENVESVKEVHDLSITKRNISFGTITKGDDVTSQTFSVINKGNTEIKIDWIQTDVNDLFELNDLHDGVLQPNEENNFKITLRNTNVEPGDYSTNIVFRDTSDSEVTVTLDASVKIKEIKQETQEVTEIENKNDDRNSAIAENIPEKKEEIPAEPQNIENNTNTQKQNQNIENNTTTQEQNQVQNNTNNQQSNNTEKQTVQGEGQGKTQQPVNNKKYFSIETGCSPSEGGYVSGSGTFEEGAKTILTAYTNKTYVFEGWYKGNQKVGDLDVFEIADIKSNDSYIAKFSKETYMIAVTSENNKYGTVTGSGTYEHGKSATIKATPKAGYVFTGWYEEGKKISDNQEYKIDNINKDRALKAEFKTEKHTVNLNVYPKNAGTVSGAGKVDHEGSAKITAKANKGYKFKSFILNNQTLSVKDHYELKNIDRDISITAYFEEENAETCSIVSGVSNKGGAISPSGKLDISKHGSITYSIATENGYAIQEVEVDGKKIGAVSSYTFKDITKDHKISVVFAPKKGNEKGVKKDKVISTKDAEKYAVAELMPAADDAEERTSKLITPALYRIMQEDGTLDEALKIPDQNITGMDGAENLADEVDQYNYDEAVGLAQALDIDKDTAKQMIEAGDDALILETAYKEGILNVIINNQYLNPGKETEVSDEFKKNETVQNMLEFISGLLTNDEKMVMFDGTKVAVNVGITKGEDLNKEDKESLAKAGATIDECFYMTVMKQIGDGESELVTDLQRPIIVKLKIPEDSKANCIVRLHEGKAEILKDIDEDNETITIRTDKFSPYAFADQKTKNKFDIVLICIWVAMLGAVAVIGGLLIRQYRNKNR